MPMYESGFSQLLWPGLRLIYGLEYNQYPEEYSKFFNIDTSSKYKEEDLNMAGFGLVPQKGAGSPVQYDEAKQGIPTYYTHVEYGMGFQVTRVLYEDDQYRKIKALPSALARSVRHTIEILGANILNLATTTTGADTKTLLATDHPRLDGGTYSNTLATAADLDIVSYEQALIDIASLVDDRGNKIAVRPKMLLIPPQLEFTAKQLLKSAQLPGTNYNDINPAQGSIGYTVCHWLTDPDAWFLTTDVPNGLTWFWRRRPEFTNDNDWETENAKFKTTFRCSQGWTDPRGIYGSMGA